MDTPARSERSRAMVTPGRREAVRDPRLIDRIEAWLRPRLAPGATLAVRPREAENGGFSSELFFVEVRDEPRGPLRHEWVLRRERTGNALFPEADFAREALVQRALRRHSTVPVPEVLWEEEDASVLGARFYVMERIRGEAPPHLGSGGWLDALSPAERLGLWRDGLERLAEIHRFDWEAAGLGGLRRAPTASGEFQQDLDWWWRLYERHSVPILPGPIGAAFARLRADPPALPELRLCWGDARHQNMLFRGGACVAVLDWEMATLGAPESDLAFLLAAARNLQDAGIPRPEGIPSPEQMRALYESALGRPLRDLDTWLGFSLLRMLVIQARFVKLGLMPAPEGDGEEHVVARSLRRFIDG